MNNTSGPPITNALPGASIDRLLSVGIATISQTSMHLNMTTCSVDHRTSTNICSEEGAIEERLLEAYDRKTIDPKDHWEQEGVNESDEIAALERLVLVQDAAKQSQLIRTLEASEDEEPKKHQQRDEEWDQT